MKVLHVFNEFKFSGAETMYVNAADIFKSRGYKLYALATGENLGDYADEFRRSGYTLYHKPISVSKFNISRLKYYAKIIGFIRENKFDLIHIHREDVRLGFAFCSYLANIRCVYTFHNTFSANSFSYFYHFLNRQISKNIFQCNFHSISNSVYENELSRFKNQTTLIYNWVNEDVFYPVSHGEKNRVRQELNINDDTKVVITVGGCSHVKRHSDVLLALKKYSELDNNFLYLHLGEGTMEKDEMILVKDLGIGDNVRFLGNQSKIRNYLVASDYFIMPSKYEGLAISVLEAMMSGVPCILYNVPGLKDFNKDKQCALLIQENYIEIVKSMKKLNNENSLKNKIIENAYSNIMENHSMSKNLVILIEFYNSIVKNS